MLLAKSVKLPLASRIAAAPANKTNRAYDIIDIKSAKSVPFGIDDAGSCKIYIISSLQFKRLSGSYSKDRILQTFRIGSKPLKPIVKFTFKSPDIFAPA